MGTDADHYRKGVKDKEEKHIQVEIIILMHNNRDSVMSLTSRTCVAGRSGVSGSIAGAFKHVCGLGTAASVLTGVRDAPAEQQGQLFI